MKKYLLYTAALAFAASGLTSCLDYDDPGDEFSSNQMETESTVHHGKVDSIYYRKNFTEAGVKNAIDSLKLLGYFGQSLTGQYCLRGAKNGEVPKSHAYQRQFSLGTDLYAQYFVVPHKDFMYGTLTSTYQISNDFNGDALANYNMVKNALMPMLNHPLIDSIPEIKAINLLYYCVSAQEMADLSGPFTYKEDKANSEDPTNYDDLETIYKGIVTNLDTIVNCLKYYEEEGNRPEWYKKQIAKVLERHHQTSRDMLNGPTGMDSYIRLANSLKLRMAMHIVKRDPALAKQWAEEAVESGVVENVEQQQAVYPMISGFSHPLMEIANTWGDLRLCASFESILKSLNHPYAHYLFQKNSAEITNQETGETMPANTDVVGIRSGLLVGDGQTYALNMRQAYSTFDNEKMFSAPLYLVKFAEVDFLRAEGAIRGWNMGGNAEFFYNRGIENGYLEDPMMPDPAYSEALPEYMAQENAKVYVQKDPMGDGEDWQSLTTVGVKWNEGDSQEVKLEKIQTQKYIALFPLSNEAWTEMRRTGYPKVFPVLNPEDGDGSLMFGEIIRRIPWAPSDPQIQEVISGSGIPALGGDDLQSTRLWWDVEAPNF